MKADEEELIKKELKEVKEIRNKTITEKAILANELDFVKVNIY
jgi:hypothetical protein